MASPRGGTKDFLKDGVAALHCPPEDAMALAARMARIENERALREQLSKNAREAAQEFTEKAAIARLARWIEVAQANFGARASPVLAGAQAYS